MNLAEGLTIGIVIYAFRPLPSYHVAFTYKNAAPGGMLAWCVGSHLCLVASNEYGMSLTPFLASVHHIL